jgi:heme exporter protein CcmD
MSMDLGAYAVFIWPAYVVTVLALGGLTVWSIASWRAVKARLAALEKT